jgi:type IV secretion system protein VirB4
VPRKAASRTLINFASILGPLGERLHRWTRCGQFNHLFDNVEDTLMFSRLQTFNFDGWSDYPDILEPLLFYVLQRGSGGSLVMLFRPHLRQAAF